MGDTMVRAEHEVNRDFIQNKICDSPRKPIWRGLAVFQTREGFLFV
jgi:hypothetical protein